VALLRGLQKALFSMALPYGFAVTIWGSGTILTRSRGAPHVGDVFLGAAGVMAAYGLLQAFGRRADRPAGAELGSADQPLLGGMLHVLAVGASLGAAALLAQISSWLAWPLAFFGATIAYLLVSGGAIGILALTDD
jgi:hypothetical protein